MARRRSHAESAFRQCREGAGLKIGERLRVVSIAKELVDPETQTVLGRSSSPPLKSK
jgi:hypothetical protein